jgi:hypothetical protein
MTMGGKKVMTRGRRSKITGRAEKRACSKIGVSNLECANYPMHQDLEKRQSEVY